MKSSNKPLFQTRFIKFPVFPEVNKSPSMTCSDLYLTTKQRVQSLLAAGQNLLAGRLGPEYFEQNSQVVNESIKDPELKDLHDYNVAARNLNTKFESAIRNQNNTRNNAPQSGATESATTDKKADSEGNK